MSIVTAKDKDKARVRINAIVQHQPQWPQRRHSHEPINTQVVNLVGDPMNVSRPSYNRVLTRLTRPLNSAVVQLTVNNLLSTTCQFCRSAHRTRRILKSPQDGGIAPLILRPTALSSPPRLSSYSAHLDCLPIIPSS